MVNQVQLLTAPSGAGSLHQNFVERLLNHTRDDEFNKTASTSTEFANDCVTRVLCSVD